MLNPMVELIVVNGIPQAELVRSVLEGNGIPCQVISSGTASSFGFTVGPMSDVPIYVAEKHLAVAQEILDQLFSAEEETIADDDNLTDALNITEDSDSE
ncbi:MAG TPA: DUF2007 domain-containing protein [Anaerolineales bacterium]|nr:DUF2007 domain-containing protein [Anaerolineales bacterium]